MLLSKKLLHNIPDLLSNQFLTNPSVSGSDATPVGTIIAFMGTTPPQNFLICDGSVYNITDYLLLANHFKAQFGSINYFGGDGTTTFAVPDLRNEFLRGYHGETTSISGEIGKHQDATETPYVYNNNYGVGLAIGLNKTDVSRGSDNTTVKPLGTDSITIGGYGFCQINGSVYTSAKPVRSFTPRPTNVAVLYCIKAECTSSVVDGGNSGGSGEVGNSNIYSEEEVVIGTWIDGKDIYRRVLDLTEYITSSGVIQISLADLGLEKLKECIRLNGFVIRNGDYWVPLPYINQQSDTNWYTLLFIRQRKIEIRLGSSIFNDLHKLRVFIEYTTI